jgi:hypothetical protein
MSGRFEEAMSEDELRVQRNESDPQLKAEVLKTIGEARETYKRLGQIGYWRRVIQFVEGRRAAGKGPSTSYLAELYALAGDKDEAFKLLDIAIKEKDAGTHLMKVTPSLDNLHSDPRWPEMLRRVNFTE